MSNRSHAGQASDSSTHPTNTHPTYTLDAVGEAMNNAADLIKEELRLGERDDDLLNLVVNASIGLLGGKARTLAEVLDLSYDPDTARELRNW